MPRITPLSLQGPAGALQAELIEPDAAPSFVATVAHPIHSTVATWTTTS